MLLTLCERAHARGKAAVPGIGPGFVVGELPIETLDLYAAVGDRQIGIDGRLAKIELQFWICHVFSFLLGLAPVDGFYHQSSLRHSRTGKLFIFRIAISRTRNTFPKMHPTEEFI